MRAAWPSGSNPKFPLTWWGSSPRADQMSSSACAAAIASSPASKTTAARSSKTGSRIVGRSEIAIASAPSLSHSDVAPPSRSAKTAACVALASASAWRARTSQPAITDPAAVAPRVKGTDPGVARSGASSACVYSGDSVTPSAVVVVKRRAKARSSPAPSSDPERSKTWLTKARQSARAGASRSVFSVGADTGKSMPSAYSRLAGHSPMGHLR